MATSSFGHSYGFFLHNNSGWKLSCCRSCLHQKIPQESHRYGLQLYSTGCPSTDKKDSISQQQHTQQYNLLGQIVLLGHHVFIRCLLGYLIVSLAVADLIVGLIVMPLNSLFEMTRHVWLLGNFVSLYKMYCEIYEQDIKKI
jgi:hypothetical protein